ncbi:endonuclease/exonuclease/phosphatase family protein [Methylomonas sp. SURF-1]|uniref:Endonuclease/exonuclease/phosphatase family protein n=1 Tax=Methylomonas aurea TaxID=2952224 RepID=A0ABT1UBK8_9GAMM|nr:endonuclease/exonuclease/phosphatase family protein [Methylomonas sp. SURF-1]MCQ8179602.1 endonuclease/exonuclease/phosphatase family protein [Methylomonas sp. SURF-1]
MKILFWNLQRKDLTTVSLDLCRHFDVDIFAFAEGQNFDHNLFSIKSYKRLKSLSNIVLYTKYSNSIIKVVDDGARYCSVLITTPVNGRILICFVHMISALHSSNEARVIESQTLMSNILAIRERENLDHIILCGDFNQNPYDSGVIAAACFNATGDRLVAAKMKRKVLGSTYSYFYNPMWRFYGAKSRPYGTYFHKSSDHVVVNWNILDQFIFSASLLDSISDEDIHIVTEADKHKLVRKDGNIDYKRYSDHLPILMTSNI